MSPTTDATALAPHVAVASPAGRPIAEPRQALVRHDRRRLASQFLRVRGATFGLAVLLVLLVLAAGAAYIAPFDANEQSYADVLQAPSAQHLFGTDDLGRDIFSRVIFGSRVSLEVGLISVMVALIGGVPLGLAAGYLRGAVDELAMRVMDAVSAFPALVLALAITAALGMGIGNAMLAIGLVHVPLFARLARGQALTIRERDYVLAARALGAGGLRIIYRHIWPNLTASIIVQASLAITTAIITEASLSFLGLSVRPPTPSWGSMLSQGYQYLETAPWLAGASGAAIFITVLGLNFLGDGVRAALDPRMSRSS